MVREFGPPVLLFSVLAVVGLIALTGPSETAGPRAGIYPSCGDALERRVFSDTGVLFIQLQPDCWSGWLEARDRVNFTTFQKQDVQVQLSGGRRIVLRGGRQEQHGDWGNQRMRFRGNETLRVNVAPVVNPDAVPKFAAPMPPVSEICGTAFGERLDVGEGAVELRPNCWTRVSFVPDDVYLEIVHRNDVELWRSGEAVQTLPGVRGSYNSTADVNGVWLRGNESVTMRVSVLAPDARRRQARESAAPPQSPANAGTPSADLGRAREVGRPPTDAPAPVNAPTAEERRQLFNGYPLCRGTQLTTVRPIGPDEAIRVELKPDCWSGRIVIPKEVEEDYDIFVESETSFEKHVLYDNGSSIVLPDWASTNYMLPSFRLRGTLGTVKITMRKSR